MHTIPLALAQFFATVFWGFMSWIGEVTALPAQRSVLIKERSSGAYRLSAYFLANTLSSLPFQLLMPSLFFVPVFWATAWSDDVGVFFASWAAHLLHCFVFMGCGQLISAVVFNQQKAVISSMVIMLALVLVAGFWVTDIPAFISWLAYLSPVSYSYPLQLGLVFPPGTELPCVSDEVNTEHWGACPITADNILRAANA